MLWMKNPLNKETVEAIVTLSSLSWSQRKISRAMEIDRRKIRKILATSTGRDCTTQDSLTCNKAAPTSSQQKPRKCVNCGFPFIPDPRHQNRQQYCSRAECRAASKRKSQKEWTLKNADYWE